MANTVANELSNDQMEKQEKLHSDIYGFVRSIPEFEEGPLINRVLVLPDPISAVTKSGLLVPDTAKERPEKGTVVAVGPGRITDQGITIPTLVKVGDRVAYGKWSGTYVHDEQHDIMLILLIDADCLTAKRQPHLVAGADITVSGAVA